MNRPRTGLVLTLLLAGGCVPLQFLDPSSEPETATVPASPFGTAPAAATITRTSYKAGATETAARVLQVGQKVLAANPQSNLHVQFITYGAPKPEIFHQGTRVIHVTDPLVQACTTEGQLAAVLSLEMAKMVAERETLTNLRRRGTDVRPPIDVPIGNAGQPGALDPVRMTEMARYDQQRHEAAKPVPVPEPRALAATYLEKAGYGRAELDAAAPLLQQAQANFVLEKQIKANNTSWTAQNP
jgi:hypothetical protein